MIDKIKQIAVTFKDLSSVVQDALNVKGGLYVDCFAVVMLVRLLGPLKGYPAMTPAEAGMWAATIAAYAAGSVGGGPRQS